MKKFPKVGLVATLAGVALVGAACGGGSSGGSGASGAPARTGAAGQVQVKGGFVNGGETQNPSPATGGTLQLSEQIPTITFDLTKCIDGPSNTTLAAVYDTLVRYDVKAGTFEPELAQSLTASTDLKTWTLKLRPGVTFTDGTALDAAAVVAHLKAMQGAQSATAQPLAKLITGFETPDAQTVVMTLSRAWARFPYLVAGCAGMIPSPAAVAAEGQGYGTKPVGAGPFKVASYTPGEKISLVRNDGYWGGKAPLDGITVTNVLSPQTTLDRLTTGSVQMVQVSDQKVVADALSQGLPGFVAIATPYGFQTNDGKGKQAPTFDPRVRQAIQAALNLDQFDQRIGGHIGLFETTLLYKGSRWYSGEQGPTYDPAKAKQLVEQVKKDTGWDGSLVYLTSTQTNADTGLTLQAMLNAVGFKVSIESVPTANDLVSRIFAKQDFQIATWGTNTWDADPWASLYVNYYSTSTRNSSGYKNPQLDQLIDQLGSAASEADAKKILDQVQTIFTDDVPFIVTNATPYSTFWSKDVHGVVGTQAGWVLLGKAYLTK